MNIFTNNPDFYPTPAEVINTMMQGENFIGKTILEPSAGKGNIVDWLQANGTEKVIACEKDENLRKLLNGKCEIIADDFLSVSSEQISHVDFIVMNPPFSEGARHILHAFEIAPAGCTIIALCNSSNLSTWNSWEKNVKLTETIKLYGYSESLGNVFANAERNTKVGVSLVKLYKDGEGEDEFANYLFSDEEDPLVTNETEGLVQYNALQELVIRYADTVKLFDETMAATEKINELANLKEGHSFYIQFVPVRNGNSIKITRQQYKKELQRYYWRRIIEVLNLEKYATTKLKEKINKFIEKQENVPFTMHNIYQMLNIIVQTTKQRMNEALLEGFDTICAFSAENSTAGEKWKTNANYMINKKFIVPYMTDYDARYSTLNEHMRLHYGGDVTRIEDVVKALCYITGTNYDSLQKLRDYVYHSKLNYGTWYEWAFFKIKGFKKGTMHFEFLDEKVWMLFNQEVAKQRGWILPKKSK